MSAEKEFRRVLLLVFVGSLVGMLACVAGIFYLLRSLP